MYLSKTIKVPLYETKVQFIVTSDIIKVVNNVYKKHNINTVWSDAPSGTMLGLGLDLYRVVINADYFNYNTIMHELLHCVMCITFDRGIHEEEARCWLIGYLAEGFLSYIDIKGIKIEHSKFIK